VLLIYLLTAGEHCELTALSFTDYKQRIVRARIDFSGHPLRRPHAGGYAELDTSLTKLGVKAVCVE
jgi:hypothetical protein